MLVTDRFLGALSVKTASNLTELGLLIVSLFVTSTLHAQSSPQHSLQAQSLAPVDLAPVAVEMTVSESIRATFDAELDGAYDQRLVEPLVDQARRLQEENQHEEASRLLQEALHLLRINNGLYDASQIDALDALIESEIALQDWESVDRYYTYMEHLYRRLYGVDDPRLEHGLQKVVAWHVNALNVNLDGKRMEHLQQASKLFKLRLQVAQLTLSADDPKLDFLYRNIAICERQLYLGSDLTKEMMQRQQKARQRALLADLD
jgi:hypothetical protein